MAEQGLIKEESKFISIALPGALLLIAIISAILVSHTVHLTRKAVGELQTLEKQRNELDVEWSQLLLEQSTLGSFREIENLSRTWKKLL